MAKIPVSKYLRLARAQELISEHPTWGRRRINDQLRKELGQGLRTIDLAREQDRLFPTRPKPKGKGELGWLAQRWQEPQAEKYKPAGDVMGFIDAAHLLRSAGFLPFEISGWADAGGRWKPGILQGLGVVDMVNSDAFRQMCRDRRDWIRNMKRGVYGNDFEKSHHYTDQEIVARIKADYASGSVKNPFDHLRIAYAKIMAEKRRLSAMAFAQRLGKNRGTEADIRKGEKAARRLAGYRARTRNAVFRPVSISKRTPAQRPAPQPKRKPDTGPWARGRGEGW